jgi:starch synthase
MARLAVLHVAAEAHPLIKTGGLADVAGALPRALRTLDVDARLLIPGYPDVLSRLAAGGGVRSVGAASGPAFGAGRVALVRGRLPGSTLPVYAIDAPWLYRRPGNPYADATGQAWSDNHLRFGLLSWTAAQLAAGGLDPAWTPALVHAHDWHAGLAPSYLRMNPGVRVPTIFTIHNLAFQGRFPLTTAGAIGMPASLLTPSNIEFHGDLSFMKAALVHADRLTTVSPTYAREITTSAFGHGMEGVLRSRASVLSGVLNGIDADEWNPRTDPAISHNYDATRPIGKKENRRVLCIELGLDASTVGPLMVFVGRLTSQKGVDLVIEAATAKLLERMQLAVLGSGDASIEKALIALAAKHRGRMSTCIGFDEALAHRMIAGADAIIVPSRFEPCGLTQMYGMRYGTVPIARRVGGLADTVVDCEDAAEATGFAFDNAASSALAAALTRAIDAFSAPARWQVLMRNGMRQNFAWDGPARRYVALYEDTLAKA